MFLVQYSREPSRLRAQGWSNGKNRTERECPTFFNSRWGKFYFLFWADEIIMYKEVCVE